MVVSQLSNYNLNLVLGFTHVHSSLVTLPLWFAHVKTLLAFILQEMLTEALDHPLVRMRKFSIEVLF